MSNNINRDVENNNPQQERRELLKYLGVGALAGTALVASPREARAYLADPLTHAMWLHGNALVIQSPERVNLSAKGVGARLERVGDHELTWVHYAIPTPVIVSERRLKLHSVMIRYRGDPEPYNQEPINRTPYVREVHIWDGDSRIYTSEDLYLTANQSHNAPFNRFTLPTPLAVNYGIGISLKATFADGNWIEFAAVGADFTE